MNQPYGQYPPQQGVPFPYGANNTYPPPQTTAYTYPNSLSQQLQHPQQQQQPAPQHQQHQQSQFFQSLPQGAAAARQQPPPHLQRQHQQRPSLQHDAQPSIPSSPGNGPGAPPPMPNSPPDPSYEERFINALRRETEGTDQNQDETENANNEEEDDDNEDQDNEGNDDEPVYQLAPPPEQIYPNEVELEKAMHAWSLEHGYELVRRASKKNARGQLYKRYFHCSKHGKTSNTNKASEKNKVRVNRKSNRIGCPMSLAAVSVDPHDPSGNWQIRHRKTHHNHPAVDAIKLAGHRRRARSGNVEKVVDGLFAIDTSTGDVLKFLQRTNPDGLFNRTDVANMKLKWKKYGTCAQRGEDAAADKPPPPSTKTGFPSACLSCRAKKTKCDSVRPVCGHCAKSKTACQYDHDPHPRVPQPTHTNNQQQQQQPPPPMRQPSVQHQQNHQNQHREDHPMMGMDTVPQMEPQQFTPSMPSNSNNMAAQNAAQAEQVMSLIADFQKEHVKPTKLSSDSSSVAILANSTCGSGDSYKTVTPRPFAPNMDWRSFKDNFLAAAVKENTNDVLIGERKEPVKPPGELSVEDHNEYIKQVAIYKRRNDMLKMGLKECLTPQLWRGFHAKTANEIWSALEDMCMPRGSDQAYMRFLELQNVTLQNCGNIDNYIHTFETRLYDYNQLSHHHETRRTAAALNQSHAERLKRQNGGNGTFPQEMLCFLFLKNLGPQHQNVATNLTKKNNIGGFGSGERLDFKHLAPLVKNALARS
ncbi:hypothetical protein PRZ48_008459 [Zasmidium cellare]|uniref:Zn(2)-C6 fungal-type domain-containing protein n=1 Tax=Zasmidium cellare TaxID=395010 RepID=A0ABR0EFJ3_ZASCE|nr:hypothetical protein PRZ48_008459 [Zasmidium cellare]